MTTSYIASVIVCVKDDWRIMRLLTSLEAQTISRDAFEVIVISTGAAEYGDLSRRFRLNIETQHSPIARLPVQRNIGLGMARGTYYLTTDADCVADPHWIERMVQAFEALPESVVAIGGSIEKLATDTMVRRFGITIDDGQRTLNYLPASAHPYVTGANSAYRTQAVLAVGGYSEQFECGDDVDVSYRLGAAGGVLRVVPDATIFHEDRATLSAHYRRFRWYAVDQALLFKMYRGDAGRRWYLNPYPWRRFRHALATLAAAFVHGREGWSGAAEAALVTAVEAAGVLDGDIRGSLKHRVLYL